MRITQPRQQLDHMLRQTRMNLVNFSQMADTKAHILLSLSSVLLSLSLTQISNPLHASHRGAGCVSAGHHLFALLTVIGKIKVLNHKKHSVNDPDYSPLFFGNYGDVPYDVYAKHFETIMNDPDLTYEIMVKDIYHAGAYLLRTKYKYIRLAYLCFFTSLFVSVVIYFIQNLL